MIIENRNLLLKDLSARLHYHPLLKVEHCRVECLHHLLSVNGNQVLIDHFKYDESESKQVLFIDNWIHVDDCKPYLRPMASMTNEEKFTYESTCRKLGANPHGGSLSSLLEFIYSHHLDFN